MKKLTNKDYTIAWNEKTTAGYLPKSFNCSQKDVAWHMKNLKALPNLCYDVNVTPRKV